MENFDCIELEKYWQSVWQERGVFDFQYNPDLPISYVLEMLYYPSGKIHMGHVRNYTIGDVIARYKRANGFNVLHPMGADAFGLPAENAAIQNKTHPKAWTYENIDAMNTQLKRLGFSYNWNGFVTTCDPEYYKHEQKMFIDFFNNDLAYQKESVVNWDPVDQTVLANEQVIDGKGWRSGAIIEKKTLKQWFLKISKYSQELLDCLDNLPNWPEKVKTMQKNWIGRSEGAEIDFSITNGDKIRVFTTRPDTIFGATFIAISASHPVAFKVAEDDAKISNILTLFNTANEKGEEIKEKEGYNTGVSCIHPFTGEELPIFVANFVLNDYGTGALMGVPAHDERDFEFAIKYSLPIKPVVVSDKCEFIDRFSVRETQYDSDTLSPLQNYCHTGGGYLINSEFLDGLTTEEAKVAVIDKLEKFGFGVGKVTYKLRDWGVSRQRYWGCPIPMVYCNDCGVVPEKIENLPITLPDDVSFDGVGNPLANHPTWKYCQCPKCGKSAIRETDTLDTFFESSWYHLRYITPHLQEKAFDEKAVSELIPVDYYIGGIEHAILHMLYARFFLKALRDCGYFKNVNKTPSEPFNRFMTQGMVCHMSYKDSTGNWVEPNDIEKSGDKIYNRDNNLEVFAQGVEKMSKSKKNIVDPADIVEKYGADTARMFVLSDTPYSREIIWTDDGAGAVLKYLKKIWNLCCSIHVSINNNNVSVKNKTLIAELYRQLNIFLHSYTQCLEKNEFNVAIAKVRTFTNFLEDVDISQIDVQLLNTVVHNLVIAIAPIVPHLAESIWSKFAFSGLACQAQWPVIDQTCLTVTTVSIAVQVNGKTRGVISIPIDESQDVVMEIVRSDVSIAKYLHNYVIQKVIFIPNKVINLVVN